MGKEVYTNASHEERKRHYVSFPDTGDDPLTEII